MRAIVLAFGLLALAACNSANNIGGDGGPAASFTDTSGSGYDNLAGQTMSYRYEDFGAFRLLFEDGKMTWQGTEGYFAGIVFQVEPQVSKVADGIYFLSWSTGNGGDNVVVNLNTMAVNAHLQGNEGPLLPISGPITCAPSEVCPAPEGDPWTHDRIGPQIQQNAQSEGLPSMNSLGDAGRAISPQDRAARDELAGKAIVYLTEEGLVRVVVDGDETVVVRGDAAGQRYLTHATKIADGVYFISWGMDYAGNHIVFDTNNYRVFDHLESDNVTRREQIFQITCFDEIVACQ